MSPCPDETELLDLVSGQLPPAAAEQIHAHVAGCSGCERMVAELARDTPAETAPGAAIGPRELKSGETIGHYVVLERLGSGGMGVVYAAFDPQLDRKVALKLLRPDVSSKDAADQSARLLGEAQSLARLSHPNVVTVYEAQALGGRVWLAMELVEGATLQNWLGEAQRTREEIVEVFVRAGLGLEAAHEAGIVHRDFKPDNVLIGDDGRVRVTDFGLARKGYAIPTLATAAKEEQEKREAGQGQGGARRSTVTGALMGTPAYMAPEQWAGKAADARSDQFSFCVALWEALTGKRPFHAERLQELPAAILRGTLSAEARPERIPKRWRRVLLKGLKADPADRHSTMGTLLHELQRDPVAPFRKPIAVFAGLTILAVGVLVGGRQRTAVSDRAALCTGAESRLVGAWDPARKEAVRAALGSDEAFRGVAHALDTYSTAWTQMHTDACLATRVRGEQSEAVLDLRVACLERRARDLTALTSVFLRRGAKVAPEAAQAAWALPSVKECAEVDELSQQVKPPKDPIQLARLGEVEADISDVRALISSGNYAAARDRVEAVVEKARGVPHAPTRAEALYQLGVLRMRTGEAPQAEQALLESAWEAQAGRSDRRAARARIELIYVVGELSGRTAEAANLTAREARAAVERLGGDADLESLLETHVAGVLTAQDKCEQALPHLRQALALADRAYETDDPRRARVLTNLGNAVRCVGDLDAALAHHREALQLRERVLGPTHPEVAVSLNFIGNVLFYKGDFAGALPYHRRTLEIRQRALGTGADTSLIASAILNVGVDLMSMGRNAEGHENALKALKIFEDGLGKDSPRLIVPLSILGHVEVDLGVPKQAKVHLERALKLLGTREDDQTAMARFNLARAMRGEHGDEQRARDLALEARRYYERRKEARKTELDTIDEWLKGPRSM